MSFGSDAIFVGCDPGGVGVEVPFCCSLHAGVDVSSVSGASSDSVAFQGE